MYRRTKVLIAAEDRDYLQLISPMINETTDLAVVGTAATEQEFFHMIQEEKPDIVVLDVDAWRLYVLQLNGMDILRKMQAHGIDIPCVITTCISSVSHRRELAALGAKWALLKPFSDERLLEVIRSTADENAVLVT